MSENQMTPEQRPHKLRKIETRKVFGVTQPEATYELVVDGKPFAFIEKYVDPKGRQIMSKDGRYVKYISIAYWTYEGMEGETDQLGYDTRQDAVKNALRDPSLRED